MCLYIYINIKIPSPKIKRYPRNNVIFCFTLIYEVSAPVL